MKNTLTENQSYGPTGAGAVSNGTSVGEQSLGAALADAAAHSALRLNAARAYPQQTDFLVVSQRGEKELVQVDVNRTDRPTGVDPQGILPGELDAGTPGQARELPRRNRGLARAIQGL